MASGDGTSDGLGREQLTRMTSLGKATQENKTSDAVESLFGLEKTENPKMPSTPKDVAQNLTPLSKGKQVVQDFKYGHDSMDPNEQSSTSRSIRSFRGGPGIFPSRRDEERIITLGPSSSSKKRLIQDLQVQTEVDFQTDGLHLAQSNLGGVAASVSLVVATTVDPNVGFDVAHLGEASLGPNGGALVVLDDVDGVEPFLAPIVDLHGIAPVQSNIDVSAQPNAALIVAPPRLALAQPNATLIVAPSREVRAQPDIAPNAAPPAQGVAPVQPDVAPHAQRNGAPLALAQPNAAVIVAPPGVARAQLNVALIVAPPAVVVLNVNHGLNCSQLKPLQNCEIGSEGHFWPKLPRN